MSTFTKRPVSVEARRYDGSNAAELIAWITESGYEHGAYVEKTGAFIIPTLEGLHEASVGDWIIQGVAGEFYPCKPDIFEQTYTEGNTMSTTIGRIVQYTMTAGDAELVDARRADALGNREEMRTKRPGYQAHVGNRTRAGMIFPAMVVRVWDNGLVNLQVFLDGNDTLWRTSISERTTAGTPGTWALPGAPGE